MPRLWEMLQVLSVGYRLAGNNVKNKISYIKGKIFTAKVVKCWNRFLREAVKSPSLATFKI